MATPTDPTMLGLPVELQQHIMSHVEDRDLLALRRTCKELKAVALSQFSEAYLHDLRCFIVDPARLLKLKNILSTPDLAAHVKWVSFDLSAFHETWKEVQIVAREGVSRQISSLEWIQAHSAARYAEFAGPRCLNWAAIWSILQTISVLPNVKLNFALETEMAAYTSLSTHYPHFSQDLLGAAKATGALRNLSKLTLLGSFSVTVDGSLEANHTLAGDVAQNLSRLCFIAERRDDATKHLPEVMSVLKATSSTLEAWMCGMPESRQNADLMHLPPGFWSAGRLDGLRLLHLGCMLVDSSDDLLNVLARCSNTLSKLTMHEVRIVEDGQPWKRIFRQLLATPLLEEIDLRELSQQVSVGHPRVFWRYMFDSKYLPEHPKNHRRIWARTSKDTRMALKANVRHGILRNWLR